MHLHHQLDHVHLHHQLDHVHFSFGPTNGKEQKHQSCLQKILFIVEEVKRL